MATRNRPTRLNSSNGKEKKTPKIICKICKERFSYERVYHTHVSRKHTISSKTYCCCGKSISARVHFKSHCKDEHEYADDDDEEILDDCI